MHGDTLSHAPDFQGALDGLLGLQLGRTDESSTATPVASRGVGAAVAAFEDYKRLLAEGRFAEAGRALERVERELQGLESSRRAASRPES
jgi:hypothetical protein